MMSSLPFAGSGKVFIVGDSGTVNLSALKELFTPDPDGDPRFFSTIDAAVGACTANAGDIILGGTQYNYYLHSVPHNTGSTDYSDSYHWHLEICPRTSIPTGFELGSGLFVNTVSPEVAAKQLREAHLEDP